MLAVLTPALSRRTLLNTVRCLSQNRPPHPAPPLKEGPSHTDSQSTQDSGPFAPADLAKGSSSPLPSLDITPSEQSEEPQRTGARSSKDSLSSIERKRRNLGRVSLAVLLLGLGVNTVYMGREYNEEELNGRRMKIEDAPSTRWGRTVDRFKELFDYFNKPAWPELLPPQPPPPHWKPYTLLISIDDLLVTSTWDRQHGWRTAKRPGVDYFLGYISQFYEVAVFTTQHHYTAIPVLEKLDRYNFFITHKLFRDATRSMNGKIVKDLSYLNRDLSKVILLDTHSEHASTHPENAIIMPKWDGNPADKGLIAMIPFLESIAIYKPPDVRPILQAYYGKDIPLEYSKKEAEAKQKHIDEWSKKAKGLSTGAFTFSRLFGGSEPQPTIPLTYLEQKRKEAQQQFKEEQAYIQAHKEEFDRLLEQDQQAAAKEIPNSLLEAFGQMSGKPKGDKAADTTAAVPATIGPSSSTDTLTKTS